MLSAWCSVPGAALAWLTLAAGSACRPDAQYIVTQSPLHVLGSSHPGVCIAVLPGDAESVWWWQPGRVAGCLARSTGPDVFRAQRAAVSRSGTSDALEVRFVVPLKVGDPLQVELELRDGTLRDGNSGESVSTVRRQDLSVPEGH